MGDVVMTLPALAWLGAQDRLDVSLVTDPRWMPLLPDVPTASPSALAERAPLDAWLELHRVPASRRVLHAAHGPGRPPVERVHKESLRRRGLLLTSAAPPRHTWPERHLRAAQRLCARLSVAALPPASAVPALAPSAEPEPGLLGIVPGAQNPTKRWPLPRWLDLIGAWRPHGAVRAFLGPDEGELAGPLADAGADLWPVPLDRLRAGLSGCSVVVAGDTGPLHVAGALGRPVVALFGPTPVDAGFWVWGGRGTAIRTDLRCSPCSLHGGERCPRGHHRCLADLSASTVLGAALRWAEASA